MSAIAIEQHPGVGTRLVTTVQDALVVAQRNLMQIVRIPAVLVFELIQPVMFVLLFVYVFAGNIAGVEQYGGYVQYLMPGIMVQNAIFGATTTAIGIAEDLKAGFVDRFRSLPMARSAMLAGRATSDLIKNFILLLVVIGIGYLVGFSFENGFLNAIWMIVLIMAVSFSFSWVMAWIALSVKKLDDPLRDDPVAAIDQSRVGCGNCGEVADAAVLCPSFYRTDIISNPSGWDRFLARIRSAVTGFLQRRREAKRLGFGAA